MPKRDQPVRMSTATISTTTTALDVEHVPDDVIDNLAVHIAGADDYDRIADMATRSGATRPQGALMVGSVAGIPLAAVSMSNGDAVKEPTASGAAAAAVVRYTVARMRRKVSPA